MKRIIFLLSVVASSALAQGPVHHWTFDETSGTTAVDSAGSNDATVNGTASWATDGERGNYISFDGAIGSNVDPGLDYDPNGTYSWAVWAKITDDTDLDGIIVGNRRNRSGVDFSPREFSKIMATKTIFRPGDTANDVEYDDLTVAKGWTHFAVVKDGDTVTAYVDGVAGTPVTLSGDYTASTMPFFIGGDASTAGIEFFEGDIDDVVIYDFALTTDNVTDVMSGTYDFGGGGGPVESPMLNLDWVGADLVASWTNTGFKLQSIQDVTTTNWMDYPGGAPSPVTISSTNNAEFFRLIEQ